MTYEDTFRFSLRHLPCQAYLNLIVVCNSTATSCRLDKRKIKDRFPSGVEIFSRPQRQDIFWPHRVGTGGLSPEVKRPVRESDHQFFFLERSPLLQRAVFGLLCRSRMMDHERRGSVGGMIGRETRSTHRKPAPVPLCPPQIPYDLDSNPGRLGGKLATKPLSYGTALQFSLVE
jgi:hypothetical protein